ncbi:MAG: hypothetical protein A4E65_00881 [Syntrophorhabdus sp. PtaU1.Bin153]|nr:MAG: hypothetical protein A4E65_00881 [Syntrophorhabdus sp. PtaU1.Bin153]
MVHYRGELNFYHWLAVSLVLHAIIIALPFSVMSVRTPHQNKNNKLAIELFGMIADRQQAEKRGGTGIIPRRAVQQRVTRQPVKKASRQAPPDTYKTTATDSPVYEEKRMINRTSPTRQQDLQCHYRLFPAVLAWGRTSGS